MHPFLKESCTVNGLISIFDTDPGIPGLSLNSDHI
nr:MAG TPA: hypothetical protein [Caudoviricetes sp.]